MQILFYFAKISPYFKTPNVKSAYFINFAVFLAWRALVCVSNVTLNVRARARWRQTPSKNSKNGEPRSFFGARRAKLFQLSTHCERCLFLAISKQSGCRLLARVNARQIAIAIFAFSRDFF